MAGSILFIVAAASSVSFALTIQQIPQYLSRRDGRVRPRLRRQMFMVVAALLMIVFGAVLEGAPALIIFGPLLTPIAQQLGVHPLHFGTVMVIAMGLGLFSPPIGLGLFATCAITGTHVKDVARPMMKYLAVLFMGLMLLVFVPAFSLWLPAISAWADARRPSWSACEFSRRCAGIITRSDGLVDDLSLRAVGTD